MIRRNHSAKLHRSVPRSLPTHHRTPSLSFACSPSPIHQIERRNPMCCPLRYHFYKSSSFSMPPNSFLTQAFMRQQTFLLRNFLRNFYLPAAERLQQGASGRPSWCLWLLVLIILVVTRSICVDGLVTSLTGRGNASYLCCGKKFFAHKSFRASEKFWNVLSATGTSWPSGGGLIYIACHRRLKKAQVIGSDQRLCRV